MLAFPTYRKLAGSLPKLLADILKAKLSEPAVLRLSEPCGKLSEEGEVRHSQQLFIAMFIVISAITCIVQLNWLFISINKIAGTHLAWFNYYFVYIYTSDLKYFLSNSQSLCVKISIERFLASEADL